MRDWQIRWLDVALVFFICFIVFTASAHDKKLKQAILNIDPNAFAHTERKIMTRPNKDFDTITAMATKVWDEPYIQWRMPKRSIKNPDMKILYRAVFTVGFTEGYLAGYTEGLSQTQKGK